MVFDVIFRRVRRREGPSPKKAPSNDVRAILFSIFMHREPTWTPYEVVKVAALSFWLPFLKVAWVWGLMIFYFFVSQVVFFGIAIRKGLPDRDNWRMHVLRSQSKFGSWLSIAGTGFRTTYHGEAAGPTDEGWNPPIVCNHQSFADIPVLAARGHTAFIAKAGISKVPFMRAIAALWEVVLVKRKSTDSRQQLQDDLRRRCRDVEAPCPVIFSEGSTTNGRGIMKFRPGIFRLARPVQPVLLNYPHKHCNLAWDTCTISYLLWRSMSQFTIPVDMYYLPLYEPNDAEREDPNLFAENVRQAMYKFAAEHGIKYEPTEANVMEKLIYQDYCDGKITWGKLLRDLEALYGGDNAARFSKERVEAFKTVCEASGYTPFVNEAKEEEETVAVPVNKDDVPDEAKPIGKSDTPQTTSDED